MLQPRDLMTDERRRFPRHMLVLECTWSRDARITDISVDGCYVDTMHAPTLGDMAEFTVNLDEAPLHVRGIVVQTRPRHGFAIRFTDLAPESADRVRDLVERSGVGSV